MMIDIFIPFPVHCHLPFISTSPGTVSHPGHLDAKSSGRTLHAWLHLSFFKLAFLTLSSLSKFSLMYFLLIQLMNDTSIHSVMLKKKAKLNTQILPLKNSGPFKNKYTEKKWYKTMSVQRCYPPWAIYGGGWLQRTLKLGKDDWGKSSLMKGKDVSVFQCKWGRR